MTVECPVCNLPFDRKQKFVRHVTDEHDPDEVFELGEPDEVEPEPVNDGGEMPVSKGVETADFEVVEQDDTHTVRCEEHGMEKDFEDEDQAEKEWYKHKENNDCYPVIDGKSLTVDSNETARPE